jgi:hypothetical protein
LTEGGRRWRWQSHDVTERRPALDALKHACRKRDLRIWLIAVRERAHDRVDTLGLRVCRVVVTEIDAELAHRVACQPVGRLGGVQRLLVNELCIEVRQRALERARDEVVSRPRIRCAHLCSAAAFAGGWHATHDLSTRDRRHRCSACTSVPRSQRACRDVPMTARQAIRAAYVAITARAAVNGRSGAMRYHIGIIVPMAMTLRLTDEQTEALRARAGKEGRSMQQIACSALDEYLMRAEDDERTDRLAEQGAERFAELLRRLGE